MTVVGFEHSHYKTFILLMKKARFELDHLFVGRLKKEEPDNMWRKQNSKQKEEDIAPVLSGWISNLDKQGIDGVRIYDWSISGWQK
ncbi:unnamed protein product [Rodentolepis nana]|uniref:Glyco_hydro_114 domain-containing protein n=1 Tax=Rodentolepis nana TaxID=102285 RepID=A0A0R3TK46_RODNA|nr:unnamed protein product [Rodentolepis nana]